MKWNAPNILTTIRIVLIPIFVLFYFLPLPHWNIYAAVIFIAASVTDWLDGHLARKYNLVSTFGKLWDPTADKLLVASALLVLMDWGKIGLVVTLILIGRELLISAVRQIAAAKGVIMAADMAGKLKTATQMVAIVLLLLNDWPFVFTSFDVGLFLIWVSAALSIYSCFEYMIKNKAVFHDEEN